MSMCVFLPEEVFTARPPIYHVQTDNGALRRVGLLNMGRAWSSLRRVKKAQSSMMNGLIAVSTIGVFIF